MSERGCLWSLQCSLTPFLLKASIKQLEGLCHRDPSPCRSKYHPPSLSTPQPPSSGASELPPHWGQPFKRQGNIMQEHRKSEETGFWAGLARSLCELQRASGLCSAGLKPAENPPRAVEQSRPQHVSGQWVAIQNLMYLIEGR